MAYEADVTNYNNLPSNNEKLSLLFKKASYKVALTLAQQCRLFNDGNFFSKLTTNILSCFGVTRWSCLELLYVERRELVNINCKYFSIMLNERHK